MLAQLTGQDNLLPGTIILEILKLLEIVYSVFISDLMIVILRNSYAVDLTLCNSSSPQHYPHSLCCDYYFVILLLVCLL